MRTETDLPGATGAAEWAEARSDGFRWSLARATAFGEVCRTTRNGEDAVLLSGEAGLRAFYDGRFVARHGSKAAAEVAILGDGVTEVLPMLDGVAHARRKARLLETMTPEAIRRYLPVLDAVILRHLASWVSAGVVDLRAELPHVVFEALAEVFVGSAPEPALLAAYRQMLASLFGAEMEAGLAARDRMLAWYRVALAAARRPGAGPSVMGALLDDGALADAEIVAETQHLFIGSGGVWALACNLLYILAAEPLLQERVRGEAREMDEVPSLEDLARSSWLQGLVEEAARWSPVINEQLGRVIAPLEVKGFTLPVGTLVVAGLYATNHLAAVYPEPLRFAAERAQQRHGGCPFSQTSPYTYVPFGGGDARTGHRCLGEPLVYAFEKLLVVRVLRDLALIALEPAVVAQAIAPSRASAATVRIQPRR